MVKKKVGDAVDDPEFEESDELNIRPRKLQVAMENECSSGQELIEPPLQNFIEDDMGVLNNIDGDDGDDEDEDEEDDLNVMEELAEDTPKADRSFLSGHPQHNTHKAHMQRVNPLVVPNFLPNTLPRSDRGDREYYCCTMLTLFKPWRSGKDLKSSEESWDEGFVTHEFTKRQMEIMKYFNLRYECLDARDDYSAKRDKKDGGISYQWATANVLDDLDNLHDSELALMGADFDPGEEYAVEEDAINALGKK